MTNQQKVIECLLKNGNLNAKDITSKVEGVCSKTLYRMVAKGLITKKERGIYGLPNQNYIQIKEKYNTLLETIFKKIDLYDLQPLPSLKKQIEILQKEARALDLFLFNMR